LVVLHDEDEDPRAPQEGVVVREVGMAADESISFRSSSSIRSVVGHTAIAILYVGSRDFVGHQRRDHRAPRSLLESMMPVEMGPLGTGGDTLYALFKSGDYPTVDVGNGCDGCGMLPSALTQKSDFLRCDEPDSWRMGRMVEDFERELANSRPSGPGFWPETRGNLVARGGGRA
jgi:hypothetical protein